jgi:hypothetical protein
MHRSGTTMITDLLQQLGLYMGWVLQENSEALFFVERNEKLMNVCGGGWEQPEPVKQLLGYPAMRTQACEQLRRDLLSLRFLWYLGPKRIGYCGHPERIDFAWGWKDPRNTYLLPLWLDLFPEARVIHIYRHPMDVARSLQLRENRNVARRAARLTGNSLTDDSRMTMQGIRRERGLLWMYRRLGAAQGFLRSLRRYDNLAVAATTSLEAGLRLWSRYVGECHSQLQSLPGRSLSIKYEDFLENPAQPLEELREFCGLPGSLDSLQALCGKIRTDRRYSYRNDVDACRIFESFRSDEWVKKLGYDQG